MVVSQSHREASCTSHRPRRRAHDARDAARADPCARESRQPAGPFSPLTPFEPVPIGGDSSTRTARIRSTSRRAAWQPESTLVEFEGRTAYGEASHIPFHVSSADWQESDRVFAGMLTAFGVRTRAIPIGGYGTFDGVMVGDLQTPPNRRRLLGRADSRLGRRLGIGERRSGHPEQLRRRIRRRHHSGDRASEPPGDFRLGTRAAMAAKRSMPGSRLIGRPVVDLRHAFTLDDYDVDGRLAASSTSMASTLRPSASARWRSSMAWRTGSRSNP